MEAYNKAYRDRYGINSLSKLMLNLKVGSCLLGAVFLFSSCVSEQSSLGINSPLATPQTVSVTQTANNGDFVSPYPPGSPIPIKAPRQVVQTYVATAPANADGSSQQIQAYQSTNAAQVVTPVAGQVAEGAQISSLASSLAVPTQNPNRTSAQIANAVGQPTAATGVSDPSLDQAQPQTSQVAALAPEITQPAPKSNFLNRWANSASSKKKNKGIRRGKNHEDGVRYTRLNTKKKTNQSQVASLTPNDTSVSTNAGLSQTNVKKARRRNTEELSALPGVKSNNEIFGIEEDEEVENTQLAALGGLARISPNGLRVQHDKVQVACLKQGVLQILKKVERRYGKKPIITSGYRSPKRNRRAGGARRSQHIYCKAVDIQVEGVSKWHLAKYLRTIPGRGGVGTYCRTKSVHIDIGSKRDWHSKCRRSSLKKRKKKKNT